MEAIEYIQFHPVQVTPALCPDYIDPDDCESGHILCIYKGDDHYHINVTPFSLGGFGVAHYDDSIDELIPMMHNDFFEEIESMIDGDKYFTLAFKITGTPDYETGHIDDWYYDLLGKVEQEGYNLVVKPLSNVGYVG